jgi:hypothetical protein
VVVEGLSERLIIVCNIYSPVSRLTAEQEAFYEKLRGNNRGAGKNISILNEG